MNGSFSSGGESDSLGPGTGKEGREKRRKEEREEVSPGCAGLPDPADSADSGGARRASRKARTLRERAWRQACGSNREWMVDVAAALESCQTLDATSAFSYFWDETPGEDTFGMGDVPEVGIPGWLSGAGRWRDSVFVEACVPECGLPWSLLFDGGYYEADGVHGVGGFGGHEGFGIGRSAVIEAAEASGTAAVSSGGDPGAVAVDPGFVDRVGALIYVESSPAGSVGRDFYLEFADERTLEEEWAAVLQFMPFASFGPGVFSGAVVLPQVIYYMPMGHDGRIRALDHMESLPMVLPDQDPKRAGTMDRESAARILHSGHRALHLGTLFSLACARACGLPGEEPAVLEDSLGPRRILQMDSLKAALEDSGKGASLGLSHALTVCRDLFSGGER